MTSTGRETVVAVIPARFGASRFPGKPIVSIAGSPMVTWVLRAARACTTVDRVVLATDDERIARVGRDESVDVAMTRSDLPSGTDRVWAAVSESADQIVINIQGDEPLLEPSTLDTLIAAMHRDPTLEMATLGRPIESYTAEEAEDFLNSMTTAKIVTDDSLRALYFSRWPIPFSRKKWPEFSGASKASASCFKHIGIYAYRRDFLRRFCEAPPSFVEQAEGLEQLRALNLGARIQVVPVRADSWGVDTPEDVERIEVLLAARGLGVRSSAN